MRLLTLAVLLGVAACGGDGPPQDLTRTELESPLPPEASDPIRAPIEALRADHATNSVRVTYFSGPPDCYALARVEVTYRSEEIALEVFHAMLDAEAVCTQEASAVDVTVELSQPIGDRALVAA